MLTVIDFISRAGVRERRCTAAQRRALFKKQHRDARGAEPDRSSEAAQSPADYDDGVGVEVWFHRGPRFNQEYFRCG